VRFIELAPVADAHAVARTVASGLGLPTQHAAESLFEVAAASYEQRSVLLIFDNCEHLQKECARIVERLLHACPSMRVLATSRMRLNIDGERVFPLSTLSLPDETDSFNPTELKK
jgi:non-specific serine/threonine protein kinase